MSIPETLEEIEAEVAKLPPPPPIKPYSFTRHEVRDIVIATVTLIFAFTLAVMGGFYIFVIWDLDLFILALVMSAIAIPIGFIVHELSHKIIAQRYGFYSYFKIWVFGIVLAIVTAFLGFLFAAPGAVYVEGERATDDQMGKISLAGPLSNLIAAGVFYTVFIFTTGFIKDLTFSVAFVCGFLAFVNLLPFGPLDGAAIYRWDKKILFITISIALVSVIVPQVYIYFFG